MKWTVAYRDAAIDELADIWMNASDQQAVADASNQIDRLLRVGADTRGQPQNGNRLIVVSPLAAVFSLSADDCLATVLHVFRVN